MDGKTKRNLALAMGVVIAIADMYWTWISLNFAVGLALGVTIFIADIIWLYLDM